jgi:hypothetical protein
MGAHAHILAAEDIHHGGIQNRSHARATQPRTEEGRPRAQGLPTLHHEFHGSCADFQRNGEASHADINGALDAAVKAKARVDNYQHDYNERNCIFLPAFMTPCDNLTENQRILRLLYILSDRQAANYFTRMGILDPSTKAFKQRRGTNFY